MQTVFFQTPTPLNILAVTTMGVSAKNSDNPIGYFGTGLKMAIAVILRNGGEISLTTDDVEFTFHTKETAIRGKTFNIIHMNDEPLGFTTDLARDWEIWMAFRELHSNVLDEGGKTSTENLPGFVTTFAVSLPGIFETYKNNSSVFLDPAKSHLAHSTPTLEIYAEPSPYIYFRGVRVFETDSPMQYTYNFLDAVTLTEDRTIKNIYITASELAYVVAKCDDETLISNIAHSKNNFESALNYPDYAFSETFRTFCYKNATNPDVSSIVRKAGKIEHERLHTTIPVAPTQYEAEKLSDACRTINRNFGTDLSPTSFKYYAKLPHGALGLYDRKTDDIKISRDAFNSGSAILLGTIYEEYMHKALDLSDHSREFQDHLLNLLFTKCEELEYWKAKAVAPASE